MFLEQFASWILNNCFMKIERCCFMDLEQWLHEAWKMFVQKSTKGVAVFGDEDHFRELIVELKFLALSALWSLLLSVFGASAFEYYESRGVVALNLLVAHYSCPNRQLNSHDEQCEMMETKKTESDILMFTIIKMSSKFSDHFRSPRDVVFGYACGTWWNLGSWTGCAPTFLDGCQHKTVSVRATSSASQFFKVSNLW